MPILIVLLVLLAGVRCATADPRVPPAAADSLVAGAAAADTLPLRLTRAGVVAADGSDAQRLAEPAGVAVDAFGRLYVSDAGLNRLQRYDAKGAWIESAGDPGASRTVKPWPRGSRTKSPPARGIARRPPGVPASSPSTSSQQLPRDTIWKIGDPPSANRVPHGAVSSNRP